MSKGKGQWRDGLRTWERLRRWIPEDPASDVGGDVSGDGGLALTALADIGHLRHLLTQAELAAVRAARTDRKSWSEIATMLGVSRQSAWERWRDLDDASDQPSVGADELARAARSRRRQSSVTVPNVVGRIWADALEALRDKGLVAVAVGPDAGETGRPESVASVVTDQVPESGAKVPPGTVVRLWYRHGGGAGVREPRRPSPDPQAARQERFEPSDEAVG